MNSESEKNDLEANQKKDISEEDLSLPPLPPFDSSLSISRPDCKDKKTQEPSEDDFDDFDEWLETGWIEDAKQVLKEQPHLAILRKEIKWNFWNKCLVVGFYCGFIIIPPVFSVYVYIKDVPDWSDSLGFLIITIGAIMHFRQTKAWENLRK